MNLQDFIKKTVQDVSEGILSTKANLSIAEVTELPIKIDFDIPVLIDDNGKIEVVQSDIFYDGNRIKLSIPIVVRMNNKMADAYEDLLLERENSI